MSLRTWDFLKGTNKRGHSLPPKYKLLCWGILTALSFWLLTERVSKTTIGLLIFAFVFLSIIIWIFVNVLFSGKE